MTQIFKIFFLFFSFGIVYVETQDIFLLPLKSEEALEILQEADTCAKNKKWEKAIDACFVVLQKYPEKLISFDNRLFTNAAKAAVQKLTLLPADAQTILDNKIAVLLKQARINSKRDAYFLYPFLSTEKGREIWRDWISEMLAKEQYQNCISALQYLSDPFYKGYDSHISRAQLNFCYYALGYEDHIAFWKRFYLKPGNEISITLGTEKTTLLSFIEALSNKAKDRAILLDNGSSWPLYGKSLSKDFSSKQSLSTVKESYFLRIPQPKRPKEQRYFYNERPRYADGPPPFYPVIGDGTIFINNGQEIHAYDLFLSHLRWKFSGLVPELKTDKHEQIIHTATYHKGFLYANLEGDTPGQQKDTWSAYKIKDVIAERRLVKLDARNGRFVWQVREEKGDEEAFANKASFVTPPLIWGEYLYSGVAELTGLFNSYIVAVNPEDGKIVWKTLIGSAQQELNMFGNPVRETVGAPIAAGDGRLYYLNNLGAFCCVDPMSGNILWIHLYDRIKLSQPNQPLFETIYRQSSWHNSPVILYEDKVYFAPVDSQYIYCLDARTGEKLWQRFRSGYSFLMLVSKNKVLLGGRTIAFLDGMTGDILSILSLDLEEVAGLGIKDNHLFYCPCNKSLYCIDIEAEKIEKSWKWPQPMINNGHIVMADSCLVSVSQEFINVFYDLPVLCAMLEKQLEQNSQDSMAYLKLADMYLQIYASSKQEAILLKAEQFYEKSLHLLKKSSDSTANIYIARVEKGLFHIYQIFSEKHEKQGNREEAYKYNQKSLSLVESLADAMQLFFKIYNYYYQTRQYQKAKECLEELIEKYGSATYSSMQEGTTLVAIHAYAMLARQYENMGEGAKALDISYKIFSSYTDKTYTEIPASEWARKNIARLIQKFGQEIYQKYDNEVLETYKNLQKKECNSSSLKRLLSHYPNSRYVSMLYLAMARKIIEEGNYRNAIEEMEYFLREYPEAEETPYIYTLLIQSYEMQKNFSYAKMLLKKIKAKYSGKRFTLYQEHLDIDSFVQKKSNEPEYLKSKENFIPALKLWKEDNIKYTFTESSHATLRLLQLTGTAPEGHKDKVFFNLANTLLCRDSGTTEVLWKNTKIGWIYSVGFLDSFLFAWTSNQLFCLEPKTGNILWDVPIPYRFASIALGSSSVAILCENYGQNDSTLYVRRSKSSEIAWKATVPGKIAGDVIILENMLIGYSQNPSVLYIYDLESGKLIKGFPAIEGARKYWDYYPYCPSFFSSPYLCVVLENRWIECYEIPSLKMLWKYDTEGLFIPGGSVPSKPFFTGGPDYITFLQENNTWIKLSLSKGEIQWKIPCKSYNVRKIISGIKGMYAIIREEEASYLYSLCLNKGTFLWKAFLSDSFSTVDILLSEEYIITMLNRYSQGYQSSFFVFDKAKGEKLKDSKVKGGDRGRTYTEMTLTDDNLWIVKDNIVWVLGE